MSFMDFYRHYRLYPIKLYFFYTPLDYAKGSRRNNFTYSGVAAPAWQGARRANSTSYLTDEQRSQAGCISV